ncbi:hypothetical protein D5H75_14255 [Bailinhaonella thermotolerans]|uniref:Cation efflux protein transmembrane domain-containing protein n=1 Tax=Bailinhaonella thermotolerans TaxID=1070861 RepID=A0A3A4B3V8_9ACTN|nr:hypothetical protein D5H75_14255 [Bailinhaonella thermotolerans]
MSWATLAWLTAEGGLGLAAGVRADSVALIGWAASSLVEGLASVIVIWRFTGERTHSHTAEAHAQKAVAVSFWLLAPYLVAHVAADLAAGHRPGHTALGIAITVASLVVMPVAGVWKRRLGARLGSPATAGEGTQNLLCAYLAAGVLAGLAANSIFGAWWVDPLVALALAAIAVREGVLAWRGAPCAH